MTSRVEGPKIVPFVGRKHLGKVRGKWWENVLQGQLQANDTLCVPVRPKVRENVYKVRVLSRCADLAEFEH